MKISQALIVVLGLLAAPATGCMRDVCSGGFIDMVGGPPPKVSLKDWYWCEAPSAHPDADVLALRNSTIHAVVIQGGTVGGPATGIGGWYLGDEGQSAESAKKRLTLFFYNIITASSVQRLSSVKCYTAEEIRQQTSEHFGCADQEDDSPVSTKPDPLPTPGGTSGGDRR